MKLFRKRPVLPVIFLMFALAACQSVATLTPAQTFNQRVANAVSVETAIIQTTTASLNAKVISKEFAEYVLSEAKKADVIIAEARILSTSDLKTAQGKIDFALKLLSELQEFLDKKGGK